MLQVDLPEEVPEPVGPGQQERGVGADELDRGGGLGLLRYYARAADDVGAEERDAGAAGGRELGPEVPVLVDGRRGLLGGLVDEELDALGGRRRCARRASRVRGRSPRRPIRRSRFERRWSARCGRQNGLKPGI